jgi:hypothetical protein
MDLANTRALSERTALLFVGLLMGVPGAGNAAALDKPARPAPEAFQGEWEGWRCPKGISSDVDRCSVFALVLYERNGHLCGLHSFALPRARRTDDGSAPSVAGTASGKIANVKITSGRADPEVTLNARITRDGQRLHFQLLTFEAGDWFLPRNIWLARAPGAHVLSDEATGDAEAACSKAH